MQRVERQADQVGELQQMSDAVSANLRVAMPGIIESYDAEAMTVVVQPTGQEAFRLADGGTETSNLPLLEDVPVHYPRGGDFTLTFPIRKGDECLVVFCDRCFDSWHQSGGIQTQTESRMHDLSDAIALVGVFSQSTKIKDPHTENVQLRHNDGDCFVEITPEKDINMKCKNMTLDIEGHFVVKANKWDAYQQ